MTQNKQQKEKVRFKKVLPVEELIQNKNKINLFNSMFKKKIEKLYIIDALARVACAFPFVLLSFISNSFISRPEMAVIFSFASFFIGVSLIFQSHILFNEYVFKKQSSNIPFIKNIMNRYFVNKKVMGFLMSQYHKLNMEERILLNSISIPKSGCDFFIFNLQKRVESSKPELLFKHKDLISLTIENIEDNFMKGQIDKEFQYKISKIDLITH